MGGLSSGVTPTPIRSFRMRPAGAQSSAMWDGPGMREGEATLARLAFALHPARLVAALPATAAVSVASIATTKLAAGLGATDAGLASVLGGLICFNTLLFFPPGGLGPHPGRLPPILGINLVPLVGTAWLLGREPWLAELVLILATGGAVLARPFGPTVASIGLMGVINVLAALLLGSAANFLVIATIAAVIGTALAPIADAMAVLALSRFRRRIERRLLVAAAAMFLDDAARSWAGAWPDGWYSGHAARFAAIAEDFGLGAGGVEPLLPSHLIRAIGRCGAHLHGMRADLPITLAREISSAWVELAASLQRGSAGEAIFRRLREALRGLPSQDEQSTAASTTVLGLTLLLAELVRAVLHLGGPAPAPPRSRFPLTAMEVRLAVQAMACVAIAIVVAHLVRTDRPYWIPLTAAILTCATFGETVRKSYERILGTIGGLIAGEVLWLILAGHPALMTIVTLASVTAIFFGRTGAYRWVLFWLTLVLSLLLNAAGESSLLVSGRLVDTLIGAVVVLVVTRFVLPVHAADVARERIASLLRALAVRLRAVCEGRRERASEAAMAAALGALRVASDAELLERGLRRVVRERVARRLDAAERLATATLSIAALPADFSPGLQTTAAIKATATMAEAAAEPREEAPAPPDIAARARALIARSDVPPEALRLEFRALAVLAVIGEAIARLATTTRAEQTADWN